MYQEPFRAFDDNRETSMLCITEDRTSRMNVLLCERLLILSCVLLVPSAEEWTPRRVYLSISSRAGHNDVTRDHLALHIDTGETEGDAVTLNLKKQPAGDVTEIPILIGRGRTMQTWEKSFSSNEFSIYTSDETTEMISISQNHHLHYMGRFRTSDGRVFVLEPSRNTTKSPRKQRSPPPVHRTKRQAAGDGGNLATDGVGGEAGEVGDDHILTELNDTEPVITDLQGRRLGSQYEWDISNLQDPELAAASERVHTVQLLIALDYPVYTKWSQFVEASDVPNAEEETIRAIYQYYTYIAHAVDLRYRSIQVPGFSIRVELSGIYIATTPEDSPWTEDVKELEPDSGRSFTYADTALDKFEQWLSDMKAELPVCDIGALFTGYTPFTRGAENEMIPISGMADINGVCTFRRGSLNLDKGLFGSIQTLAHEIGHNLGAIHDNSETGCDREDQYIMSPYPTIASGPRRLNQFTFSQCSVQYFNQHLDYLTLIKANCLLSRLGPALPESEYERRLSIPPGQFLSLDTQCRIMHGNSSFYCRGDINDRQLCQKLYCYNPQRGGCLWSRPAERAAEGSTCGNKQWCHQGECVHNESAPATRDYCLSGDNRGRLPGNLTCGEIGQIARHLCYRDEYRRHCCQTCLGLKDPTWPECPYGDRQDWCHSLTQPADCYTLTRRENCCQLCRSFELPQTGGDCLYGDRASWCHNLASHQCYVAAETCCQTCKTFANGNLECLYGDKAVWCATIPRYRCYVSTDRDRCCKTCAQVYEPVHDCEFGDKGANCTLGDCMDPGMIDHCCHTCRDYRNSTHYVTMTTTMSPTPTVNTTPTTYTAVTATTTAGAGNHDTCRDQHVLCRTTRSFECYHVAEECCKTCMTLRIDDPACEFGDRYGWCGYLSLNMGDCLDDAHNLHDCCGTCKELGVTRSTTTPLTSQVTSTPTSQTEPDPSSGVRRQADHTTWTAFWHAVVTTITVASVTSTVPQSSPKHVRSSVSEAIKTEPSRTDRDTSRAPKPTNLETSPSVQLTTSPGYSTADNTKDHDLGINNSTTSLYDMSQKMEETPTPTTTPAVFQISDHQLILKGPVCERDTRRFCRSLRPRLCYHSRYREICCKTCERYKTNIGNCEYGDRYSGCPRPGTQLLDCEDPQIQETCCMACWHQRTIHDCSGDWSDICPHIWNMHCYMSQLQSECCQTCHNKQVPILGCEFGDKASWCSAISPWDCYNEGTRAICCQRCYRSLLPHPGLPHSCRYGNQFGPDVCSASSSFRCYEPSFRWTCCALCSAVDNLVQMDDCQFGDRVPGCTGTTCSDPANHGACCYTCRHM